ncbi:hypothetical protein RDI58_009924 [Solanum bulbocastanum]|uniref:Uncharacterized protein n=1 Tax=Solanum bulbocastanum TaxID=147425 RepID=A0AAN8YIY1_SOLBU
MFLNHQPKT